MHERLDLLARPALFALALAGAPTLATAETTSGYSYMMTEAGVPEADFERVPLDYDGGVTRYVEQGPEFTAMWNARSAGGRADPERATFARGERRMGVFVPRWDFDRPWTEAEGWTSYGKNLSYDRFQISLSRGHDDRTIGGREAQHHVLETEIVSRTEGESAAVKEVLTSDLWILPDLPYSTAPFAVDGIYGDPRLKAAMEAEIGALGMVARVHSTYSRQAVDETGEALNAPYEDTHMAWISDLEPADVTPIDLAVVSEPTMAELRAASRKKPRESCGVILDGGTPAFVADRLPPEAHEPFVAALAETCRRAFPDLAAAQGE
jgi:hypothetical protein